MSTILLIEDNPHIMKINAEALSLSGYNIKSGYCRRSA